MSSQLKATRVDHAYERLKTEILEGGMPPGFQAPEPEIALRFGMSRTPVREALVRLEAEGLVELIPRRGARVLPISPDDMSEIYEILTALESEAAAAIATRGVSKSELTGLEEATRDMEQALKDGDLDVWAEADNRFHRLHMALHKNHRMAEIVQNLFDQAHRARLVTLRLRELPTRSTREHREILKFIRGGAADKAREAFRKHRQRAAAELLSILEHCRLGSL